MGESLLRAYIWRVYTSWQSCSNCSTCRGKIMFMKTMKWKLNNYFLWIIHNTTEKSHEN